MRCGFVIWVIGCTAVEEPTDGEPTREGPAPILPEDTAPPVADFPGCPYVLEASNPADGSTDAFYRNDIEMQVTKAPPAAAIIVTDRDGIEVPGASTLTDRIVRWNGDPREPNTFYTATLQIAGCEDQSVDFLVSSTGLPAGNVTDRVFSVDLDSGTWTEPPNVGILIAKLVPVETIWLSPEAMDDEITMTVAFVTPSGNQAPCLPTVPFAPAPYEDPYFEGTTESLSFDAKGVQIELRDATLSGAFEPNGGAIDALSLSGTIDTRPIEAFLPGSDLCLLVDGLGASCKPCPDLEERCLDVRVEQLDATVISETVVERTEADIETDPACAGFNP